MDRLGFVTVKHRGFSYLRRLSVNPGARSFDYRGGTAPVSLGIDRDDAVEGVLGIQVVKGRGGFRQEVGGKDDLLLPGKKAARFLIAHGGHARLVTDGKTFFVAA